jgi:hypothetical protein
VKNRFLALLVTAAAVLSIPAAGQSTGAKPPALPRTLDGKPDLSGVWAGPGFMHKETSNDTDVAAVAGFETKDLPFRPGGEAMFFRKWSGDLLHDDPEALCLPDGFPREALSPYATQILQPPGYVVILYEYERFWRIIPTDGRPHPKDVEPTWMGDSVGRWEGDTLVVDTTALKEWELDGRDHMHSDALHVIERFRRSDAKTIAYEITIDDPKIFTRPWSQNFVMKLHPTWKLLEQVCEENNRDLQHYQPEPSK